MAGHSQRKRLNVLNGLLFDLSETREYLLAIRSRSRLATVLLRKIDLRAIARQSSSSRLASLSTSIHDPQAPCNSSIGLFLPVINERPWPTETRRGTGANRFEKRPSRLCDCHRGNCLYPSPSPRASGVGILIHSSRLSISLKHRLFPSDIHHLISALFSSWLNKVQPSCHAHREFQTSEKLQYFLNFNTRTIV